MNKRKISILTTIGIVFVLVCFLPFILSRREQAIRSEMLSNVKQIGQALRAYAKNNDGQFPLNLRQLYPNYIASLNILVPPGMGNAVPLASEDDKSTYVYISGFTFNDQPDTVVLYYESPDSGGRCELHLNGNVIWRASSSFGH